MFDFCADPSTLGNVQWFACFLTTGKQVNFYLSFGTVLLLLAITAPAALAFGFAGAVASRSRIAPVRWLGMGYTSIVRGVPDIVFFLFFVIALDQGVEYVNHLFKCPDQTGSVWQGNEFKVCAAAKVPLSSSPQSIHEIYNFFLAVITFAIVYGAFSANVLFGAMRAVPRAQLETAEAYGMSHRQTFWRILIPQMWVYALPGLSNLWMVLIKATPLLFLLGVEDIVYWAREIGATANPRFTDYPHGDWRMWYFLGLLIFYLGFTKLSEAVLERIMLKLTHGQATMGGERQRRARA